MIQAEAVTSGGLKFREAAFQDYEQIVSLQFRFGLAVKGYEEWSQIWLSNPLYRELAPHWPIGWVIENQDRRIVASIGNIPLPYEWNGRSIVAAAGVSWVAEPAYRSPALLLLDRLIHQPGVDLYLNNTVTKESAPAIELFDCVRTPVGKWDESAFWITGCRGFSESLLTMKGLRAPWPLSGGAAALTWLHSRWRARPLPKCGLEVQACSLFDDRFDDFWMELRRRFPKQLLGVRSRAVLEWHFGEALRKGAVWLPVIRDGRGIVAYALFDRRDNSHFGLRRVRLIDFQCRENDTGEIFGALLSWALHKCREVGVHMLENVGRWLEAGELIDRYVPYRRKLPAWSYYYRANRPELAESLKPASAWSPSLFDGNASL